MNFRRISSRIQVFINLSVILVMAFQAPMITLAAASDRNVETGPANVIGLLGVAKADRPLRSTPTNNFIYYPASVLAATGGIQSTTGCMQEEAGFGLNCTANDVSIANVLNITILDDGCAFPGDTVTFSADFEVVLTAQARHDVGLWFAVDGDPNGDGAMTGECTPATPSYAPDPPWLDLDGTLDPYPGQHDPSGVQDTCGDIDADHNPLYPNVILTAVCADADGNGYLDLPNCTSWRQPGDNDLCTAAVDAVPGAPSKCKCDPGFNIPINIPGQIVVDKVTAPAGLETLFDFTVTGTPTGGSPITPITFSLADETAPWGSEFLYEGTYSVVEASNPIFTTGAVCSDGSPATAISLQPGEIVTCTFTNTRIIVAPEPRVIKGSADGNDTVATLNEPGGSVTINVTVYNDADATVGNATLVSLVDNIYGDITTTGHNGITATTCAAGGTIAGGGSYSCSFTVSITSEPATIHDTVTAALQNNHSSVSDMDDANVVIANVAPAVDLVKDVTPATLVEPGGAFNYTLTIYNTSGEQVTITALTDDNPLPAACTGLIGQTINPGGSLSCSYSVTHTEAGSYLNTASVTVQDNEGSTASDTDSETVTVTDTAPDISITKSADPTHVPETGGNVTFTFVVTNDGVEAVTLTSLTDTVFGDLNGQGTCATGGTIVVGGSYSCSITEFLSSDSLTAHYNIVTVIGTDNDGTTDTATDDETVTFDDINPDISITKTANPTHVPETGGNVTFTFVVANDGAEDVTLTSLTDSVFGDLDGQGDCATGGTIAVGGSYSCSVTKFLSSDSLTPHYNVVTAVGTDDDGSTDTATDDETVTFDDVSPAIQITKTANPTHVPETGGDVTFTFLIENIGVEDVTITSLSDTVFGNLGGKGTCVVPQTILIGGSYTCEYTVPLASDSLTPHTNVVTATAVDDDDTSATDTDDETVTFDDVAPAIRITKTANPTHIPETGGNVTFTFLVENIGQEDMTLTSLSDTVFGNLDGKGTCDVPQTILIGGSYSCTYTILLSSDSLTAHYNVVTATAVDDDGTSAVDDDDATVTFDDVAPAIRITKTADPTHVPETGGDVTFNFLVENIGVEDVTLTSLSDTVFGDLDGKGTCDVPQAILIDGSYSCEYTVNLASDSLTSHYNVVTATAVDDDGTSVTDNDDETVTFDDVAPLIQITKTANPTHVPETGGDVTFTFLVENIGQEDVALTSLTDTVFGNLSGKGTCSVPQQIFIGGSYSCTYTAFLASDSLAAHTNVVTATAVDDDNTPATDDDDETVTFDDVAPDIRITKTANPTSVPETGGNVTFTFLVENIGVEDVTLTSLSDTVFGDLDGKGTCVVPQTILIDGSYSCAYTVFLSSDSLTAHTNVVTANAVDDDNTPATDTDDETVTFVDVAPLIRITKTADPTSVPETGGFVTFTFLVENIGLEDVTLTTLSDTVFGNLDGQGNCDVPQTILIGGSHSCSFIVFLSSDSLTDHTNVVTAIAVDDDGTPASDDDSETVSFNDVAPAIFITKTASPTHVPETGGNVTFTFEVTNSGPEDVTLTSLTDTVFGDLNGQGDCDTGGLILKGGSYSCSITVFLSSDSLTTHYNVVTAVGTDDDGTSATDDDNATVTFDDVPPMINITKTASPTQVPETGGNVTFTFLVENIGVEDVTLTSLLDTIFGDLDGKGTCDVPQTILIFNSYSCEYTVFLSSDSLAAHHNVVTATAVDDDNTQASDTDDETVTFDDVAPAIRITKTADPTHVPETGSNVTFTFLVENIGVEDVTLTSVSDTVFGDLDGKGTCVVPQTILIDGSYSCTYTILLASDSLAPHYNVVTATAVDDDGASAADDDDETVTFDDVAPAILITKTASPTHVPETGGNVSFMFKVENIGQEDVTLTSLTDTVFGDLDGKGSCDVPQAILIGDDYLCTFTVFLASDSLTPHYNVVTATAVDDDGTEATDDDDETVTFEDVAPAIQVTKTANPTHVPETGGNVTFTFLVENIGQEDVTLTALSDTVFGDLNGKGSCVVPQTILIGGSYSCEYTVFLASDSLTAHHNVSTATAVDDDNTPATDDEDETVTFDDVAPVIRITKSAYPTSVPETGGDVTFTFLVENIGVEDVTLTTLSDTKFGDLNGQGDCVTGGLILVGGSYSCSIIVFLASDSLTAHYNVVTAVGTDDDGTSDTATDDETVTFDDVAPAIRITKTAAPTHVPETGGDVTFTFLVENTGQEDVTLTSLTDTKFGDLSSKGTCVLPQTILIGSSYSCVYTVRLASDSLTAHYNVVTATAVDDDGTQATDDDDETVTFDDIAPLIQITKTADPTHVPETGGNVTFTFLVENIGVEDVTLTSLSDTVFGDLNGQGGCVTGGLIAVGGSYTCSITKLLASDSLTDHYNVVTAVGTDDDGSTDTATDDETVTFDNVLPAIDVTKTANPTYVLIPGGNVTFTFIVKNTSTEESVTITSLSDSVYGTLTGDVDCAVGTVLAADASCEFSITQFVSGFVPGQHVNVFAAIAVDNDATEATDTDDATVDILAGTSKIAPTQTTCQMYRDGTALDYTELLYNVSKGKIGSVAPGVIFFWSTIIAPDATTFTLEGHQFNDSGTLAWWDLGNLDVFLWDANCDKVQDVTIDYADDGHPILNVANATPGATYYFSIKYDTNSLTGISVKRPYPTVNYTFETYLDTELIATSPDSVAVKPKK